MATKLPNGKQQFLHPSTGKPLVGGKVWHYVPGTTDLKDTWKDAAQTVLNTNPVVLDAYGAAVIWGNGAYRQVLLDASNNQIWDVVTSSGISDAMDEVVGADTISQAQTAFGISAAMKPVLAGPALSTSQSAFGISTAMQPVVGAATLAAARTALGIDSVGLVVYNVKSYGAVGDGVTDDTAAINAAIAACTAGIVYFPSGTYKVTSSIFVKPGVSIWGNSMFTSTIVAGANNVSCLAYIASALATGFEFFNIGFSSGGYTGVNGIYLNGVDSSKRCSLVNLQNVYMGPGDIGVYMNFCANVVVDNFFANTTSIGMWLENVADAAISNSKAQNGSNYGFYVKGGPGAYDEGIKLVNCSTNGQATGFTVVDQDWGQMANCSFSTASLGAGNFVNSNNWRVTTTDFASASTGAGLTVDANCNNIQISECFFALNSFGVNMRGTRNAVRGCHFTANTNVDVYLFNAGQCNVANNVCDSAGAAQSIVEAGTTNYTNIVGNSVIGTVVVVGANSQQIGTLSY